MRVLACHSIVQINYNNRRTQLEEGVEPNRSNMCALVCVSVCVCMNLSMCEKWRAWLQP